ncbi:hypothetical protein IYX23_05285 [Methylocystis sp. L43]|uniref:hypothetical protein n=1 Tax=unclassified Methylocystis TaxID=2625913 RepID=UPI0018C1FA51|nr:MULTISPECIES: hypothetical protein [unclassified Methylocystis]MBG0797099.1 hypothetical protein [Methylocystis sp. L43]MBG0805030.1 hypothetical protein [Methylocystis sp. H15]
MTVAELPLAAQIGVAIVTAFVWFAATCFAFGVYLGARDVIAYLRTPRHLRAERFTEISKFHE